MFLPLWWYCATRTYCVKSKISLFYVCNLNYWHTCDSIINFAILVQDLSSRQVVCGRLTFRMNDNVVLHDEIEIEDFEYDEEEETYYYPCPCGDRFSITKVIKMYFLEYFLLPTYITQHYDYLLIIYLYTDAYSLNNVSSSICRCFKAFNIVN